MEHFDIPRSNQLANVEQNDARQEPAQPGDEQDNSMAEMQAISGQNSLEIFLEQEQFGFEMQQPLTQTGPCFSAAQEHTGVSMPDHFVDIRHNTPRTLDETFWELLQIPVPGVSSAPSSSSQSGPSQWTPNSNQSAYTGVDFDSQPSLNWMFSTGEPPLDASTTIHHTVPATQQAPELPDLLTNPLLFLDQGWDDAQWLPPAGSALELQATERQANNPTGEQSGLLLNPQIYLEDEWGLVDIDPENDLLRIMEYPQSFEIDNSDNTSRPPWVVPTNPDMPAVDSASNHPIQAAPGVLNDWVSAHNCANSMFSDILPRPVEINTGVEIAELDSGPMYHIPRKGKRRPNTEAGREKIKAVRRSGACLRCRLYKESCDEDNPCGRCRSIANTAKLWVQPCYREPLHSIIAFRAGNARAGMSRSELRPLRWDGLDPARKAIILHYPFQEPGARRMPGLSILCRKFHPSSSDVLVEPWTTSSGDIIKLTSTPYGCYDVDASLEAMKTYLNTCKPALLDEALLGVEDDIVKLGMKEAQRYSSKHQESAVSLAMNIQAASHFSRTRMQVSGNNALGLSYFNDLRVRENEMVPIPAVLDVQIDYMAIKYMLGQMLLVSKLLGKLIFPSSRANWYEVYLAVFVLLHSLETVHARQAEIIKRFEDQPLQSQVKVTADKMKEEWQYSAKVLIYHYRAILKGMVPFGVTWNTKHEKELRRACELDDEALNYLNVLSVLITKKKTELKRASEQNVNNDSALPLVWISRLYIDDYCI